MLRHDFECAVYWAQKVFLGIESDNQVFGHTQSNLFVVNLQIEN